MKKGDLKRRQILDTAERLFYERGYDHTGVQDILDALGMSKGGFYHYFEAKDQLLRELCARRWEERFERVRMELNGGRRSPMDKLNLLMGLSNLFEAEDERFAALMLKVCYRDGDASIRECRRRTLIEGAADAVRDAFLEGVEAGVLHARNPVAASRLLLLLACDVNDEACELLATEADDPDAMLRLIDLLNAYREAIELLAGAPFGSLSVFDPARMVLAWQAATEELRRLGE